MKLGNQSTEAFWPKGGALARIGLLRLAAHARTVLLVGLIPFLGVAQWTGVPTGISYTSGNVGIGTPNPVNPFHVRVGTDQNLLVGTYQGSAYLQTVNDAVNATTPMQFLGSQFSFRSFNGTGNLGIGTATPAAKLHIALPAARATAFDAGNANTWADTIISNPVGTVGPATGIGFDVDAVALQGNQTVLSGIAAVRTNANVADGGSDLVFISRPVGYVSAERMRITSAGSVGIGTANPSAPLHVFSTSPILARFQINNGAVANRFTELGYDGLNARLGTDGSLTNLYFQAGAVAVTGNGNVGIGTTNPVHKLHVVGTIGAQEVIVSSTGADYVFDPKYRLQPLTEVASYIREHHHLPDVPAASDTQAKGMNLGDMQTKLLAKIEELTLHMIQADDRNSRLEQRNQELQKENLEIRAVVERLAQDVRELTGKAEKR